jgi:hypothetical protein
VADTLDMRELLYTSSKTGANVGGRLGAIYKRAGVKRGVPDVTIYEIGGRGEPGLFIELKARGKYLEPHQILWRNKLRARGYVCEMVKSVSAFNAVLNRYLDGSGEPFDGAPSTPMPPAAPPVTNPSAATPVTSSPAAAQSASSSTEIPTPSRVFIDLNDDESSDEE